ncbi:hypothetical protein [Nostoc sp. CALU 1950]|uniref:hypothetical protein n=1 Tax=Nostoc sp. CALU 1950 TaxID=3104321 RepID=UPI003EBB6AEE
MPPPVPIVLLVRRWGQVESLSNYPPVALLGERHRLCGGKVTEAVTRGKLACNYYATNVSAFMMIGDSDAYGGLRLRSSLLKSSDFNWSRN